MSIEALNEARLKRSELVRSKNEIAEAISHINGLLVKTLPRHRYEEVAAKRAAFVQELMKIDSEIAALKPEIQRLSDEAHGERHAEGEAPSRAKETVTAIGQLRDEYQRFAADRSRVSSMRAMASEFALKLTSVIREAVKA